MERAVIHSLTFAANDLAMAAGLATLEVVESEHLVENAANKGARLLATLRTMTADLEMVRDVRGKGLLIGIEFGQPRSLKLKAAWSLLDAASVGLFCQMITIPLCKNHHILAQVAGHASHTVKLLPALVITDEDCDWIEHSFREVISDCHRVPSAIWSFGRTLATQAWHARSVSDYIDKDVSQSS
jgi:ornithine--oxo-acid transaminase